MTRLSVSDEPTLHLDVLVHREGEYWVARNLQLDILTAGELERLPEAAAAICKAQICYAVENELTDDLIRTYHPGAFAKFLNAHRIGSLAIAGSESMPHVVLTFYANEDVPLRVLNEWAVNRESET